MSRFARWGAALAVTPLLMLIPSPAEAAAPTLVGIDCVVVGATDPLATNGDMVIANVTSTVVAGETIQEHWCTVQAIFGPVHRINGVIAGQASVVEGHAIFEVDESRWIVVCTHLRAGAILYDQCYDATTQETVVNRIYWGHNL